MCSGGEGDGRYQLAVNGEGEMFFFSVGGCLNGSDMEAEAETEAVLVRVNFVAKVDVLAGADMETKFRS